MAPVRRNAPPPLTVRITDARGKVGSTTVYQNTYTLVDWGTGIPTDPLYDLLVDLKGYIEALSDAAVTGYDYLVGYDEIPQYDEILQSVASPSSDVFRVGVFSFKASDGKKSTISVPSFRTSKLVPANDGQTTGTVAVAFSAAGLYINVEDSDVVDFIQFLLTGAHGFVPGPGRFNPATTLTLVSLQEAYAEQRQGYGKRVGSGVAVG